ncbi:hypothetical protein COBT_003761, partial [Conglomerata obtusa]
MGSKSWYEKQMKTVENDSEGAAMFENMNMWNDTFGKTLKEQGLWKNAKHYHSKYVENRRQGQREDFINSDDDQQKPQKNSNSNDAQDQDETDSESHQHDPKAQAKAMFALKRVEAINEVKDPVNYDDENLLQALNAIHHKKEVKKAKLSESDQRFLERVNSNLKKQNFSYNAFGIYNVFLNEHRREVFLKNMSVYIRKFYNYKPKNDVISAIGVIYDVLNKDWDEFLMFLAISIQNTSGFRYLTASTEDRFGRYAPRGLLSVAYEQNYYNFAKANLNEEYVRNPETLASLAHKIVFANIVYFKSVVGNNPKNFDTVLKSLYGYVLTLGKVIREKNLKMAAEKVEIYDNLQKYF